MTWVRGGGMAGQNAMELIEQFGPVSKVCLKGNGEIEAVFSSGQTAILGSIFKYGYRGTGPDMFGGWLTTAGFYVTEEHIANMKPGEVLHHPPYEVKHDHEEWQKRKKREEEEARKQRTMKDRENRGLCPLCGQRQGFFKRLYGIKAHSSCSQFVE